MMNNVGALYYNNIEIQQGFSIINSMKKLLKSNWFTPLEKTNDKIGGKSREVNDGSMPPLRNTIRKPNSLMGFAIGLVVIATIIVYHNSLKAPFIFDDMAKIVNNPDIQQLSNLKTKLIYKYSENNKVFERNDPSRPLVYLTFTLNYYFGKLNPFGYHLFNLIIHIFNAILVFFLAKKIISGIYEKGSTPLENVNNKVGGKPCGASGGSKSPFCNNVRELYSLTGLTLFPFLVSLLFAIHPINTNTVTYIFSRSDLLATFFYISSLLLFIKATDKNLSIFKSFNSLYILSLICFILAIFSKQIAVTLPAIILIYDYIFLNEYKVSKVIEKKNYHIPYWLLFIGYLAFRYFYLGGIGDIEAESTWNRYSYLIIQPYIILRYLKMLLIPTGLSIDHIINPVKLYELKTIISFIFIIVVFLSSYIVYRKKTNISKLILFSILWFFIILSPTSSIFPTTSPLVENRLYLSGIGFFIIFVIIYFTIFKSSKFSNFAIFPICIYILLLGYGTMKRNHLFQNPILLWQDVIIKYPNSEDARNNLGILLFNLKRYEEAEKEYKEAIKINPNNSESHYNLGVLLYSQKRYEEAEREYKESIKINPTHSEAHNNYGALLFGLCKYGEAENEFKYAISINPYYIEAHNNLGSIYLVKKEYDKALNEFEVVYKLLPNNQRAFSKIKMLKQLMEKNVK